MDWIITAALISPNLVAISAEKCLLSTVKFATQSILNSLKPKRFSKILKFTAMSQINFWLFFGLNRIYFENRSFSSSGSRCCLTQSDLAEIRFAAR